MSDDKSNKTSDMARRIWLAGLGAYGKAYEEGRDALKGLSGSVSGNTSDAFEKLAKKGEELEMTAKVKGMQVASKTGVFEIDDRIKAMRDKLTRGGGDERLDAIEAKLDAIEAKLDTLLKSKASPKRATTTRKKTTGKKTT